MRKSNLFSNFFIFLVYIILYLPILTLILYSFNDAIYSMKISGFSLRWYQTALQDGDLWHSTRNSLLLGLCSSTITTFIAAISTSYFYFYKFKYSNQINQIIFLLIIVPDIILAVGLLLLFHLFHIPLGFMTLLIAHITFSLPFSILVLQNRLRKLPPNLFIACQDLGVSDGYAFKKVIFPLLKNACLSAWLLNFTLSFDDVLVSYFIAGPDFQILPLHIYSLIRSGITPEINALCSIVFCLSVVLVSSAYSLSSKGRKIETSA